MTGTTPDEIRQWLREVDESAPPITHMIVACDEFEHDDFPIYVHADQDVRTIVDETNAASMTKVHEVYAMHLDFEMQLRERIAWHPVPAPPSVLPDPTIVVAKAPGRKPPERPGEERHGCATQKAQQAPKPALATAGPREPDGEPVSTINVIGTNDSVFGTTVTLELYSDGSVRWRD